MLPDALREAISPSTASVSLTPFLQADDLANPVALLNQHKTDRIAIKTALNISTQGTPHN